METIIVAQVAIVAIVVVAMYSLLRTFPSSSRTSK